jgi:hypothetical protein
MPAATKQDLLALTPDMFASKYLLECVPHVFKDDADAYIRWKSQLGVHLDVDPRAIALVGSSCAGVSLNPYKDLKPFGPESDVDIAIVSSYHFEIAWRRLRELTSAGRIKLDRRQAKAVADHKSRLIFWGSIATDRVLSLLPFGKTWVIALSDMAAVDPTVDRQIRARIYRDFDSLRAYQLISVKKASQRVAAATEEAS